MKKKELKNIAKFYNVNYVAFKAKIKEDGFKLKEASEYDVIKSLVVHCGDLFYCRAEDDGDTVEYLEMDKVIHASRRLSSLT